MFIDNNILKQNFFGDWFYIDYNAKPTYVGTIVNVEIFDNKYLNRTLNTIKFEWLLVIYCFVDKDLMFQDCSKTYNIYFKQAWSCDLAVAMEPFIDDLVKCLAGETSMITYPGGSIDKFDGVFDYIRKYARHDDRMKYGCGVLKYLN